MNWLDKNKFFEKLLIFTWIIFLFICLGLLSFTSYAASDQDYFPMEQNKNNHFGQNEIDKIASTFDDENYYIFVMYRDYNYFLIRYPKADKTSGMICGEKSNNLQTFSLYQVGSLSSVQGYQFQFLYGNIINQQTLNPPFNYFQNLPSSNFNSNYDYISNYIIFTNNTAAKQIVLLYDVEPEYTDPDNDTYPNNFEQPNFSNYVDYGSAPTFDGTSLESMVESLYNLIKWNFNTLIPGVVNYIIDGLNWALQKVINNIRNVIKELQEAIEDFVDTINGWLSDIKDQIDYIIEPLDPEELHDTFSGTSFASDVGSIQTNFTSFVNQFNNVSEPSTYTIPIHFENISMFHEVGIQYIDLGWINPVKNILRAFLWCVVTYGLIAAIFDAIPNYINGGGDESD